MRDPIDIKLNALNHVLGIIGDKLEQHGWHIVIPSNYSLHPYLYTFHELHGITWTIHMTADHHWFQDSKIVKLAKTYAMVNKQVQEIKHIIRLHNDI